VSDDAEQRDTFLALEEIINHAIKRCRAAETDLQALAGGGDERVSMASQEILGKEEKLVGAMSGFLENAPAELLATRFQYLPEEEDPPRPGTPEDAAARLANINHQVTEVLDQLSNKTTPPEHQDALEDLRQQVETFAQYVSMTSVTLHDP
jgi:hypothetical protein